MAVSGPKVAGLTGVTLQTAPEVCRGCVWWQSRPGKPVDKRRWIEKAETEWGPWGTVYCDSDGNLLGSMQYGPAALFPRATRLPAGPPSDDAVLVTCAYLVDSSTPWVMQSLFLAAIGESKDKGAKAMTCPVCHMALSTKKTKDNPTAIKIKGKTYYCCAKCDMHKKAEGGKKK